MLNSFKQIVNIYKILLKSSFMQEVDSWSNEVNEELTEDNKEKYLNDNKDKIISFLENVDIDNDELLEFSDTESNNESLVSLWRILRALELDTFKLQEWIDMNQVIEKIRNYSYEAKEISEETHRQTTELSNETSANLEFNNKLSSLNELDLFNLSQQLDRTVNSSSEWFNRKWAQRALQNMWYDISYTNRNWEIVDWEAAIDWDLWQAYSSAMKNFQNDLWVAPTWELDQTTVDVFQSKISTLLDKSSSNIESNDDLESSTKEESLDTRQRTIEENDSSMEIIFWVGEANFEWLKENINFRSFESMVKNMSFDQIKGLYTRLVDISKENNLNERTGRFRYTPFNIEELKNELNDSWYEADWFFGWIEMGSIMQLFENIYQTQEKFNNWVDFKDKLAVIIDYNWDWYIDNEVRFYTKEKQLLESIQDESNFENLLSNLWYSSIEEFNNWFNENYYWSRSEFKERLASVLDTSDVLNPWAMLVNPNALKEFNEYRESLPNIESSVSDAIDSHEKTKDLPAETRSQIKLQAVWAIVGSSTGLWAWFDVSEATNNLIDSAWFGIINWVPWIGISKNIFKTEDGWFRVDAWAVNFIPILWAAWELSEWEINEFKELFPNEIDWSAQVNIWAWISTLWSTIWIEFNNLDESTKLWIERAKWEMSEVLDRVFEDIEDGKTFEESNFSWNEQDRIIYQRLSSMLEANWGHANYLKEWALNNYERTLYENADGLNFSGVWFGLAFVAWYLPIPLLLVKWENHSTEWRQVETYSPVWSNEQEAWYVESWIESNAEILSSLESFEDAFSWRTRYNKGSIDFLTTSNDLNTRWQGLERLSIWVRALREANLGEFLSTVESENDKWIVISTLSQYMKKANDFDNWDLSSWNERTSEFINTDRERRSWFNEMFWFNTDQEAQSYYSMLESWDEIWKTNIMWLGFDATASKNVEWTTVKWVDTLYTNLSVMTVDWEPLLVPVTDKSKIDSFIQTLNNLQLEDSVKQEIISWLENWDVELSFYKDPEGFDDRLLLTTPWESATVIPNIDVYQPGYNTLNVWVWIVWEQREKNDGWQSSEPWVEGWQSSRPWVENEQWPWTWWWNWGTWVNQWWRY